MTADLVAELRGIIAAKPPHVTVLADNEEVYPIRVELLREAADAIESGHEANVNCNRNLDHLMARLAAQQTILSTLEGERRRLTERLAAAELVVEAARTLRSLTRCDLDGMTCINETHHVTDADLCAEDGLFLALDGYEKAYSSKPDASKCGRCGEVWVDWDTDDRINHAREHADDLPDLNSAKQEGK